MRRCCSTKAAMAGANRIKKVVKAKALPSTERLEAVLFDVDGTLTDSDPLHLKTFQVMLMELGYNQGKMIDEEFFRTWIAGRHNEDIAKDLFPEWDEVRQREVFEEKEARFRKLAADCLAPIPGLTEFMQWIDARGLKKAAVTNAPRANAEIMLQGLGLEQYFHHLVIGAECERAKPHPDPYLMAMERCGVAPDAVIVIEDSPAGMAASIAAGIATVGIQTGQTRERLEQAGASLVIQDYYELMKHLNIADPPVLRS